MGLCLYRRERALCVSQVLAKILEQIGQCLEVLGPHLTDLFRVWPRLCQCFEPLRVEVIRLLTECSQQLCACGYVVVIIDIIMVFSSAMAPLNQIVGSLAHWLSLDQIGAL